MRSATPIVAVLCFIALSQARGVVLDTLTVENNNGQAVFVFDISEARLDRQPSWVPGKQPVPLTIDQAIQTSRAWIGKQPWSKQFGDINQITLESQDDCWFYYVYFDSEGDRAHANPGTVFPGQVMILLDGSVVEPRLKQPVDSK
jgi:hypothetical protein